MKTIKVPASTILSFITGRLYSTTPPTMLFGDMLSVVTGQESIMSHQLPTLKKEFSGKILAQLPMEFQKTVSSWEHTPDWKERVDLIDEAFGSITISFCA